MIKSYTLKTVPFAIMRPALKTLMASALMVFGQTADDLHKSNVKLTEKIFLLREVTNKLENPTRHNLTTHLTAWYGVALELADALDSTSPELAGLLRNVCKEADWIAPAWVYMKGQMEQWQES